MKIGQRSYCKWTQEEIDYLYDSWGSVSMKTIMKKLQRGRAAIEQKAEQLNLGSFFENGNYVTIGALRKALGYTHSHVFSEDWLRDKNFPIRSKVCEKRKLNIVYLDSFWKWAKENKNLLNFSKFEKYALGPEPKWVDEKRKNDIKYNNNIYTKWTDRDDQYLISLVDSCKYTLLDLSKILGRKEECIKARIYNLGLKTRPNHSVRRDWTEIELEIIVENIKKGYSYEHIQNELDNNRSVRSIQNKVFKMFGTQNLNKVCKILNEKVS